MKVKHWIVAALCLLAWSDALASETIVMMRHGEKPDGGLGQLNCKGLRRALALPGVLAAKYGRADAVFAPNPAALKNDQGTMYAYIRPLATIEPTAIRLGLPVNVAIGYEDVAGLQAALLAPALRDSTVFVAWEHREIEVLAKAMLKSVGGADDEVPTWKGNDFDSLYVMRVSQGDDGKPRIQFSVEHQGLDGLADSCPELPR
ncbi:MAG: histidine phosphatase family protein [Burkholderiales bacterium]|nr:histidine phosphatase family protein [Burkholderiales bacterium]